MGELTKIAEYRGSTSDALDRLHDQLKSAVSDRFASQVAGAFGDSPIEKLLHLALTSAIECGFGGVFTDIYTAFTPLLLRSITRAVECGERSPATLILASQNPVSDRRPDFVVHVIGPMRGDRRTWQKLIVECDGFEFHERTKEQAASDRSKDRRAILDGFSTFRFLGTEIWNDPWGCAAEIIEWAQAQWKWAEIEGEQP